MKYKVTITLNTSELADQSGVGVDMLKETIKNCLTPDAQSESILTVGEVVVEPEVPTVTLIQRRSYAPGRPMILSSWYVLDGVTYPGTKHIVARMLNGKGTYKVVEKTENITVASKDTPELSETVTNRTYFYNF